MQFMNPDGKFLKQNKGIPEWIIDSYLDTLIIIYTP